MRRKPMLACLLTDAAFHLTLLHTDIESTAKKVEEQIPDNDCCEEMFVVVGNILSDWDWQWCSIYHNLLNWIYNWGS